MELRQCQVGDVVKLYYDSTGQLTSTHDPTRITEAVVVAMAPAMILLGWTDEDGEGVPACVWSKDAITTGQLGYDKFIRGGYAWGFYAEPTLLVAGHTTSTTKRVKCVDNYTARTELTLDKVYDVVEELSADYKVIDDHGHQSYYLKKRFVVVSDEVVKPATQVAPISPPPPQDPPFDFDAYNGIKNIRKVHIP